MPFHYREKSRMASFMDADYSRDDFGVFLYRSAFYSVCNHVCFCWIRAAYIEKKNAVSNTKVDSWSNPMCNCTLWHKCDVFW